MLVIQRTTKAPKDTVLLRVGEIEIAVVIMDVSGCRVKVGIKAPQEVSVIRAELVKEKAA